MSKTAVVFWSGTGNTEEMAQAVAEGMRSAGADAEVISASRFSPDRLSEFDAVAFGCPAMGAEQLEDTEFEPVFNECKSRLGGKRIGLFGSYGWGDGEWMRTWEADCREAGVELAAQSVICCELPDEEAKNRCAELGKALA